MGGRSWVLWDESDPKGTRKGCQKHSATHQTQASALPLWAAACHPRATYPLAPSQPPSSPNGEQSGQSQAAGDAILSLLAGSWTPPPQPSDVFPKDAPQPAPFCSPLLSPVHQFTPSVAAHGNFPQHYQCQQQRKEHRRGCRHQCKSGSSFLSPSRSRSASQLRSAGTGTDLAHST